MRKRIRLLKIYPLEYLRGRGRGELVDKRLDKFFRKLDKNRNRV